MDQNRITEFVEENMKTIFAYALSRVSKKEDAEDLAGDIVLAILTSAQKLRNDDALFGYIWAIAGNTYKKFLQKRNRNSHGELEENVAESVAMEEVFTEEIIKYEQLQELRRELSLLSREYRECTIAYYMDGLSCAKTAKKLGISLEMVKYYLFKTRKLLKEGIGMEREFGEKSYKPSTFQFVTIFSGAFNAEYRNLFNRKLPGNILLSAYYTPMTIRELSIELGVSSAYMEDEVALLEKYHLLTAKTGGKYQTNLVIFTDDYRNEFYRSAEKFCVGDITEILKKLKECLPEVRKVGFRGADMEENRILWSLLWLIMHRGYMLFDSQIPKADELYHGETGTNYGTTYEERKFDVPLETMESNSYECHSFAGYSRIDDCYAAAFADFGVLPKKNHYLLNEGKVRDTIYAEDDSYVIFEVEELKQVEEILAAVIQKMADLYARIVECGEELMKVHAPKSVEPLVEKIMAKTTFFHTVGLLGKCAVDGAGAVIPEDDKPVAVFAYKTTE